MDNYFFKVTLIGLFVMVNFGILHSENDHTLKAQVSENDKTQIAGFRSY